MPTHFFEALIANYIRVTAAGSFWRGQLELEGLVPGDDPLELDYSEGFPLHTTTDTTKLAKTTTHHSTTDMQQHSNNHHKQPPQTTTTNNNHTPHHTNTHSTHTTALSLSLVNMSETQHHYFLQEQVHFIQSLQRYTYTIFLMRSIRQTGNMPGPMMALVAVRCGVVVVRVVCDACLCVV